MKTTKGTKKVAKKGSKTAKLAKKAPTSKINKPANKLDRRYKINQTFEYNKKFGPFEVVKDQNKKIKAILGNYGIKTDFFGYKTNFPLGVAAGPLYNKDYMTSAMKDGFSVATWKTFRSLDRLAHRKTENFIGHNIVFVPSQNLTENDLSSKLVGKTKTDKVGGQVSITNSFGMPSQRPQDWLPDITTLEKYAEEHDKYVITSVVGTPKDGGTIEDLAEDYAFLGRAAETAGARIIEINLSCPNVCGAEGQIFKDPKNTAIISKMVKDFFYRNDTKLLIKVGYADKEHYKKLLTACSSHIDGVVAINTIPMEVVDEKGKQALPGGMKSGICGTAILDFAVKAVENLVAAKKEMKLDHVKIVGCGGVMNTEGFIRHIDAGAEFVMCATAALFNPELPVEVAKYIRDHKIRKSI